VREKKDKFRVGSLVIIKIRLRFSREFAITPGDYGVIISEDTVDEPLKFDYLVMVHGITCYVFKNEIELVIL